MRSMSATRSQVVLFSRLACGVERPQPRWSKVTMRYSRGSKKRRDSESQPAPGPPCTKSTGKPSGEPLSST